MFGFWKFFAPIVNFFARERNLSRILPGALPPFPGIVAGARASELPPFFSPRSGTSNIRAHL